MSEFLELAKETIASVNIGYTVLFVLILLYWLSVFIGALDIDLFNIDLDLDNDTDLDLDSDSDLEVDGGGALRSLLLYFNIGEVPLMIVLTFTILSMWAIGVFTNYYLNPGHNMLIGTGIFFGNLLLSLNIAKFCTIPFKKLFRALGSDAEQIDDLTGKICIVRTSTVTEEFGQVELKTNGAPLLLNAKTYNKEILKKGDEAVIVERNPVKGIYYVTKMDLSIK